MRLYNKVTQLSSYHLANKEVLYVQTPESHGNILPRGGPIQNPLPPLLEVVPPTVQSYTVKSYTVNELYNCIVIIRQTKRVRYIQATVVVRESYSKMYASNTVGRRRVRIGRPEPEAD